MKKRVLVLGDSIAYGSYDTAGGWVSRLKQHAHKLTLEAEGADKFQVYNLGNGGDTSEDILKRMRPEIEVRSTNKWPVAVVFSFGTCDERVKNGSVEVPLAKFRENTKEIINIAKEFTNQILFVGTPPLQFPEVTLGVEVYSDSRIKEYDENLRDIAQNAGVPYVPIRGEFMQADIDKLFCYDEIHPNDKGHKLIADTVQPELLKLIGF